MTDSSAQSYEKTGRTRDNSLSRKSTQHILLDTSFLLTMLNQHRDPEEEIRTMIHGPVVIQTLDRVMFELGRLARTKSSKLGAMAEASLELVRQRNYLVLENKLGSPEVDTTLIAFALTEKKPIVVATVDKRLRETLNTQGIATIYPKTRNGLVSYGSTASST